jgi:predicted RNA-binding protein with PUA-like domain
VLVRWWWWGFALFFFYPQLTARRSIIAQIRKKTTTNTMSTQTKKRERSPSGDNALTSTPAKLPKVNDTISVRYWVMKSEPDEFSFSQLERDKTGVWDGVRNRQASGYLKTMQVGDLFLFYHSVSEKSCVGIGRITETAFQDPTDQTGKWVAVGVAPLQRLNTPVSLATIKKDPLLAQLALVRQQRLSVMPATEAEWARILELSGTKPCVK